MLCDVVLGRVQNDKLRDGVCRETPYEFLEKWLKTTVNVCCIQNSLPHVSDCIVVLIAFRNQVMKKQTGNEQEDDQKVADIVALASVFKVKLSFLH